MIDGRYRLEDPAGSGGMGIVWRATDTLLARTVALKQARDAADKADRRRITREARNAARLRDHPHVVPLYDVVFDGESRPWLVMEFIEGPSLVSLITGGALPVRRAAHIGAQIADALAEAHLRGVVHRDVKPHNVLFRWEPGDGRRDHALLTDFGISQHADATVTSDGTTGTPAYMSPEVASDEGSTSASDVFSLGSTLFAAVTGSPPFGTEGSPLAIKRRVQTWEIVVPPSTGALRPVLEQMLQRDPRARPTAQQAAQLLHAVAADAPPQRTWRSAARDLVVRLSTRLHPAGRREWRIAAATGCAIAVAAAIVAVITAEKPSGDPVSARAETLGQPVAVALPTNMATTDPCGLADPAVLRSYGDSWLEEGWGFFARCDAFVDPGSGEDVDVKIEFFGPTDPPAEFDKLEDVGVGRGIFRGRDDGRVCDRWLQLSDGNRLNVSGNHGAPEVDRCAMAEAAFQHAIAVLRHDGVPVRAVMPPPNSLAYVDACSLTDASALSRIPGFDPATADPGIGGWRCDWIGDRRGYHALVLFDRNEPFTAASGELIHVGGRDAVVTDGYSDDGCSVRVSHRPFTDFRGDPSMEVVIVDVGGSPSSQQNCALARGLAESVTAKLPPA